MKSVKLIALVLIVVLSSNHIVIAQTDIKCGDEIKVVDKNSTEYQGKLLLNYNDMLTIQKSMINQNQISFNDISNVYRVKRHMGLGILLGTIAGGAAGIVISNAKKVPEQPGLFGELNEEINQGIEYTVGGALIGAILGGVMGHSLQTYKNVECETIPLCKSNIGTEIEVSFNF